MFCNSIWKVPFRQEDVIELLRLNCLSCVTMRVECLPYSAGIPGQAQVGFPEERKEHCLFFSWLLRLLLTGKDRRQKGGLS